MTVLGNASFIEASIASAATCDLGASSALEQAITGTVTITSFGTALNRIRFLRFTGILILTYNATSLILPGRENITTGAGDTAVATSDGSGNWTVHHYTRAAKAASLAASVASPTGTTSATQLMMGLGSTFALTPKVSGRIHLTISGDFASAAAVFGTATLMYGTGTAPSNGAGTAGTQAGSNITAVPNSTSISMPFSKTVIITGLTVGTAYWFDLKLSSNNGVSVAFAGVDCSAFEF
jgi:hypothetical protein